MRAGAGERLLWEKIELKSWQKANKASSSGWMNALVSII
jgi:hypothetical protein